MDHEFVILEAELLQIARLLLQKSFEGLADIGAQVVLGKVECLEVARAVDDWNGSFTLKVILTNLEHPEVLIL